LNEALPDNAGRSENANAKFFHRALLNHRGHRGNTEKEFLGRKKAQKTLEERRIKPAVPFSAFCAFLWRILFAFLCVFCG
jgi:hypothetical protein